MKTVLHTKIDASVKEDAKRLAAELGIPLSTIINAQLREFVRSGHFAVSREPQVADRVMDELEKASKEAHQGKNIDGPFDSVEEMFAQMGV